MPSSCINSSVDGWMVSPRKSRKKSACFSSTTTSTPARANRNPSIIPAGPPPAMQQRVLTCRLLISKWSESTSESFGGQGPMQSVPGAVATGSRANSLDPRPDRDPVATAPGTDLTGCFRADLTTKQNARASVIIRLRGTGIGVRGQKTVESWFRTAPGQQLNQKIQEIRMRSFKAIVSLSLVVAFSVTAIFGQATHYDVAGMDTNTSACADFYQYANGGWLAANPI